MSHATNYEKPNTHFQFPRGYLDYLSWEFVTFSVGTNGFHGPKNGGTDLSDIEIEEEEDDDVQVLQQVLFLHQHSF